MKVSNTGDGPPIDLDHPNEQVGFALLTEVLGSVDPGFVTGILLQLADASRRGQEIDVSDLHFMLSVIKGIEPRDQLEAMLAVQMAAMHMAT